MSNRYRKLLIDTAPKYAVPSTGPVCSKGSVDAVAHVPSLPQCSYCDSAGAQCELERGHKGRHTFEDDLFMFLQVRTSLQGPICRTRRGPAEYIYEEGPMCL